MRTRRPLRRVLGLLALALTACAGAPKKAAAPVATATPPAAPAVAAAGKKRSPYAPAQEDPGKRGNYVAGGLYAPGVADSVPDHVPDVDAIPEPEVTDEPRSPVGNRTTYTVLGKSYRVLDTAAGYVETGIASFYGKKFHGRRTSNLEVYDMYAFTAAHKTLPLPSFARVTNLDNGKSVVVRVNDRGPFHDGRIIDLSYAAATKLGYVNQGTARVEVRALTPGDPAPTYARATDRQPQPQPQPQPGREASRDSALDKLVAAMPIATAAAADKPGPRGPGAGAADYRFDMRQDGRPMGADEFEAWMKSRQVRIATGQPAGRGDAPGATALPPATPVAGTGAPAPDREARVVLQVASFTARANADRALAMLHGAGIAEARLADGDANGQKVWRLRVGPLAATAAPGLAERIAGLGFGPPQRVPE